MNYDFYCHCTYWKFCQMTETPCSDCCMCIVLRLGGCVPWAWTQLDLEFASSTCMTGQRPLRALYIVWLPCFTFSQWEHFVASIPNDSFYRCELFSRKVSFHHVIIISQVFAFSGTIGLVWKWFCFHLRQTDGFRQSSLSVQAWAKLLRRGNKTLYFSLFCQRKPQQKQQSALSAVLCETLVWELLLGGHSVNSALTWLSNLTLQPMCQGLTWAIPRHFPMFFDEDNSIRILCRF